VVPAEHSRFSCGYLRGLVLAGAPCRSRRRVDVRYGAVLGLPCSGDASGSCVLMWMVVENGEPYGK
jgi:hypothetical protein